MTVLLRARVFHTPRNPFTEADALETLDGALALTDGRVGALGSLTELQARFPNAPVLGDGQDYALPGFVDTHVHYPQVRVIAGLGMPLLDWLDHWALPEEARLAEDAYAEAVAAEVEDAHGAAVEVVTVGDAPLDAHTEPIVAAAREAMLNAAKFAGAAGPIDTFA